MSNKTQQHDTQASGAAGTAVLRLPTVILKTGLGRSTIYDWMGKGHFPRPIHLGPRAVGWLTSEIEQWVLSRRDQQR